MNDKALNIKIPSELYNALKQEAEKKNISLAALVRLICSEYLRQKNSNNAARPSTNVIAINQRLPI
ncbi:MAG: hypothetical protein ACLVAH_04865 [Anaeromassilibacillus sp.]